MFRLDVLIPQTDSRRLKTRWANESTYKLAFLCDSGFVCVMGGWLVVVVWYGWCGQFFHEKTEQICQSRRRFLPPARRTVTGKADRTRPRALSTSVHAQLILQRTVRIRTYVINVNVKTRFS